MKDKSFEAKGIRQGRYLFTVAMFKTITNVFLKDIHNPIVLEANANSP